MKPTRWDELALNGLLAFVITGVGLAVFDIATLIGQQYPLPSFCVSSGVFLLFSYIFVSEIRRRER